MGLGLREDLELPDSGPRWSMRGLSQAELRGQVFKGTAGVHVLAERQVFCIHLLEARVDVQMPVRVHGVGVPKRRGRGV